MKKAPASERSSALLHARAEKILRSAKIRPTEVRKAVLVALLSYGDSGLSARQLAERAVLEQSPVSVASYYRVLREMHQRGVLIRRETLSGRVWYYLNS